MKRQHNRIQENCTAGLGACLLVFALSLPSAAVELVTTPTLEIGYGTMNRILYSPDGKYLVTGGSGGIVIWDAESGARVRQIQGGLGEVYSFSFSSDSRRLAAGYHDQRVRLWDLESGILLATSALAGEGITQVEYLWDGSVLATLRYQPAVILHGQTLDKVGEIQLLWSGSDLNSTPISQDRTRAAKVNGALSVDIFDFTLGQRTHTLVLPYSLWGEGLAFAPGGTSIAVSSHTASFPGLLAIWDYTNSTLITKLSTTLECSSECAVLSLDGSTLVNVNCGFHVYDTVAAQEICSLSTRYHYGRELAAVSPDGTRVATGSDAGGPLFQWDSGTGDLLWAEWGYYGTQDAPSFSPDGEEIQAVRLSPSVQSWNAVTGLPLDSFPNPGGFYGPTAYSAGATRVAAAEEDGDVVLWSRSSPGTSVTLQAHAGEVVELAFSPTGAWLATWGIDENLCVWNTDTGELVRAFALPGVAISPIVFTPDESRVAVYTGGTDIALLEISTGLQTSFHATDLAHVNCMAFSKDGSRLVTGEGETTGTLRVWDAVTRENIMTLQIPHTVIVSIAVSPDGTHMLTSEGDTATRLYAAVLRSIETGEPICVFQPTPGSFSRWSGPSESVFSPDATQVLTRYFDGRLLMWDSGLPAVYPPPVQFQFPEVDDAGGWDFQNSLPFDPPQSEWTQDGGGGLLLRAANNTACFGFWDGPLFSLGGTMPVLSATRIAAAGESPFDPLYTAEFVVRSSVADRARTPQLRLRVNSEDLQESWMTTVESRDDGIVSPDADGESYSVVFSPGPDTKRVRLAFDLLNFDPLDDATGDLVLESATVTRRNLEDLAGRTPIRVYSFMTDTEGWTSHATAAFDAPTFDTEPGNLTLAGNGGAATFGFWTSPIQGAAGDLLIATFLVQSDVAADESATVPQLRLRLNEYSLHLGSALAIESRGDGSRSPVAGEPRYYTVFLRLPEALIGRSVSASFDYLNFDPADNPTAMLKLDQVIIGVVNWPWWW